MRYSVINAIQSASGNSGPDAKLPETLFRELRLMLQKLPETLRGAADEAAAP